MFHSARFAVDADYRAQSFRTSPSDRPLVAQFAANDPDQLFAAASHIRAFVDGIDINLGCPQNHAKTGLYGAYLLDRQHWPLVGRLIQALLPLGLPVSVKIRLLPSLPLTLSFLTFLVQCGASLIAVHGRQRGSCKRRRHGPANMAWMTACVEHVRRIAPATVVVVNGNVRCFSDALRNLAGTGADGVMVGEALLANPLMFAPTRLVLHPWALQALSPLLRDALREEAQGEAVTAVELVHAYLDCVEEVRGVEWSSVCDHVWNLVRWSASWDESARRTVKERVRSGIANIPEMRAWVDHWDVRSTQEMDRRARTRPAHWLSASRPSVKAQEMDVADDAAVCDDRGRPHEWRWCMVVYNISMMARPTTLPALRSLYASAVRCSPLYLLLMPLLTSICPFSSSRKIAGMSARARAPYEPITRICRRTRLFISTSPITPALASPMATALPPDMTACVA